MIVDSGWDLDLARHLRKPNVLHWWVDKRDQSVQDAADEWNEARETARWST